MGELILSMVLQICISGAYTKANGPEPVLAFGGACAMMGL